jgi:hypothetical protein
MTKSQQFAEDIRRFPSRFQFRVIEAVRAYDRGADEAVIKIACQQADAGDDYETIVYACRDFDKGSPYERKSSARN